MLNPPNPMLDAYMRDVGGYLRDVPPAIREGELQELSGHLGQLTADLGAQGHSAEMAASLAIGRFGSARHVGLRLRDVWEGNRGAWATIFAVWSSNWLLQALNLSAFFFAIYRTIVFSDRLREPLIPLFTLWVWGGDVLLPLVLNFVLGRWGGRRAVWATLLVYSPLFVLFALHPLPPWNTGVHMGAFRVDFPTPHPLLTVFAAVGGAWTGSLNRRRRRWAVIGGATPVQASAMLRRSHRVRLVPLALWLGLPPLMGVALYGAFKRRVEAVNHPATPETAVRVLLSEPGMNPGDMTPSTNVTTRLLPPATARERANLERRVAYTATLHATLQYRQRRVVYYRKGLQLARRGKEPEYPVRYLRASLQRLLPEGYTVSGVARVRHTAQGWKVDTSGDASNDPRAWLYDALYGYAPEKPRPEPPVA